MLNLKRNKIIFIALIIFTLIMLVYLFFYFNLKNSVIPNENILIDNEKNNSGETEVINKEEKEKIIKESKENVDLYILKNKIVESLDAERCNELRKVEYKDNCIFEISNIKNENIYCDKIFDERLRVMCTEIEVFSKIINEDEAKDCYKLQNDNFNVSCLNYFFLKITDENQCDEFNQKDQDRCRNAVQALKSTRESNLDYCESIESEVLRQNCKNIKVTNDRDGDFISDSLEKSYGTNLNEPDTDGDGLIDGNEIRLYKTNPKNPDSDGDGYTDGDEVRGGYNPNGDGAFIIN